jgi:hypothetical protein
LVDTLAKQLRERLGAPDFGAARAAAEQEVAFAASLCDHPRDTLIAVRRTFEDGAIREAFRTCIRAARASRCAAFSFLERREPKRRVERKRVHTRSRGDS